MKEILKVSNDMGTIGKLVLEYRFPSLFAVDTFIPSFLTAYLVFAD